MRRALTLQLLLLFLLAPGTTWPTSNARPSELQQIRNLVEANFSQMWKFCGFERGLEPIQFEVTWEPDLYIRKCREKIHKIDQQLRALNTQRSRHSPKPNDSDPAFHERHQRLQGLARSIQIWVDSFETYLRQVETPDYESSFHSSQQGITRVSTSNQSRGVELTRRERNFHHLVADDVRSVVKRIRGDQMLGETLPVIHFRVLCDRGLRYAGPGHGCSLGEMRLEEVVHQAIDRDHYLTRLREHHPAMSEERFEQALRRFHRIWVGKPDAPEGGPETCSNAATGKGMIKAMKNLLTL